MPNQTSTPQKKMGWRTYRWFVLIGFALFNTWSVSEISGLWPVTALAWLGVFIWLIFIREEKFR